MTPGKLFVWISVPANWKLAWMVCADAMVVAVIKVAGGGTAVVGSAGLGDTFVPRWALQQPVAHITLQS